MSIFTDKNMQYSLVTLIWSIADHFKKLYEFIEEQNQEKFTGILQFVAYVLNCTTKLTMNEYKDDFLMNLERLKLMVISIYKFYFLSFLADQIKPALECEV